MGWYNTLIDVVSLLRSLPNILDVQILNPETRHEVAFIEKHYAECAVVPIINRGIEEVLGRRHACVLIKTGAFRPPPMPSVLMVEEMPPLDESSTVDQPGREDLSHLLAVGNSRYHIIGEELIGSPAHGAEEILWISESFIMFPGRRTDPGKPALFLLPPVPFPELQHRCAELGIQGIASCSPSSPADDYLRKVYGFHTDKSLGSLLVGFDER